MTLLKSLQIFAQQSELLGQKSGSYINVERKELQERFETVN